MPLRSRRRRRRKPNETQREYAHILRAVAVPQVRWRRWPAGRLPTLRSLAFTHNNSPESIYAAELANISS